MKKYLILIDNTEKELDLISKLIENKCLGITVKTIHESLDDGNIDKIIKKIEEIISGEEEQKKIKMHIVVDACLASNEHELNKVSNDLSGIKCMNKISEMMKTTKCEFFISLMTCFFFKQVISLKELVDFKNDKKNNFLTVILKPFLENGTIDNGYSVMPQYSDILPKELLSKKYITSFENILLYKLEGEE